MFKYKNKINGKIATQEFDIRYYLIKDECHVPSWIVENSNDWELIVEKPVFTTEDGVEIFKEGDFFIVDTDYNQEGSCYFAWSIEKLFIKNKSYLPISSCVKIFSTEKAAKNWIDLNKPMYSKKDLLNASINMQYGGWFIDGLIKRINKINF